jgi:hypothetical protein
MSVKLLRSAVLAAAATVAVASGAASQQGDQAPEAGWTVRASAAADLWFYGLATVGFGTQGEFPLYSAPFAESVRAAKQEAGLAPTALDEAAAELLEEFEQEAVFQALHFIPLYFAQAEPEEMLFALQAVAQRNMSQAQFFDSRTRFGIREAAGIFREGDHREVLERFVEVLQAEWAEFFADYWTRTIGSDSAHVAEVERRWTEEVAPPVMPFLESRAVDAGTVLVSAALGPEGRIYEGSPFRRLDNVVAVRSPQEPRDPDASAYAILRESCFSTAADAVRAGLDGSDSDTMSRTAVRCGSLLLEANAPEQVERYEAVFLAAALESRPEVAGMTFAEVYFVERTVLDALRQRTAPRVAEAPVEMVQPTGPTSWILRPAAHADLWFHTLAVIAADQPGPLGMYSADYARRIRDIKRERGVYPTPLDSLAIDLRENITERGDLDVLHFVPLYFPLVGPEQLLEALRRVANRQLPSRNELMGMRPGAERGVPQGVQPTQPGEEATARPRGNPMDAAFGMFILDQSLQSGRSRDLLKRLVEAAEIEWEVFYRDYWDEYVQEQAPRFEAMQMMWDTLFVPHIGTYLERRRITAGLVFPSPPMGPEGRIVEFDELQRDDQIVSVQMPLGTDEPEVTIFAFLKELCFLLVDDQVLGAGIGGFELEDLRRRAAVRCGALILDFYAPTLASRYRRVFLDAVGAEDSKTNEAFERVYFLAPDQYQRLREEVRRR